MTSIQIVVEGHGEQSASQLLVRRVMHEVVGDYGVNLLRPQRRTSIPTLLVRDGQDLVRFQRVAEVESDRVLWLLDHDDGCALHSLREAYRILEREVVRRPTAFAFIPREYETLFLENPESCEQYFGIPAARFHEGRELRDAKGHISRQLPRGTIYKPTVDQVGLTARLNFGVLQQTSRSFQHLVRAIRWLCGEVPNQLYPSVWPATFGNS